MGNKPSFFAFSVKKGPGSNIPKDFFNYFSMCLNHRRRHSGTAVSNDELSIIHANGDGTDILSCATDGIGYGGHRPNPVSVYSKFGKSAICLLGSVRKQQKDSLMFWLARLGHAFNNPNNSTVINQMVAIMIARGINITAGARSVLRDMRGIFAIVILNEGKICIAVSADGAPDLWVHKKRGAVMVCGTKRINGCNLKRATRLKPGEVITLNNGRLSPVFTFNRPKRR